MVFTKNSRDFVCKNQSELRCLISSICFKFGIYNIDDLIQDIYTHILSHNLMSKYNRKRACLSTFLYKVIINVILGQKKSNANKVYENSVALPEYLPEKSDIFDTTVSIYRVSPEYQNLMSQNMDSDSPDGIGFDLRIFKDGYLSKREKHYKLLNRKNHQIKTNGCTLTSIYNYLFDGLTSREIAKKYGVSSMFISLIKRDIATRMESFGIRKVVIKRRKYDRNKMSKV